MWIRAQRAYLWLNEKVPGFVLIEIVVVVCLCVKFVVLMFRVLRHFGIE
jgi:hypothetical protein